MPDLENPVLLNYNGPGAPVTYFGPATKKRYIFGGATQEGWVDGRDVPGMLKMKWVRGPYFTLAEQSDEEVVEEPAAKISKEAVESEGADDGKTDNGKTDDGKTDDGKTDDGKTKANDPPALNPAEIKAAELKAKKLAEKEAAEAKTKAASTKGKESK